MRGYAHKKIERRWQKVWEKEKLWHAKDNDKRPKFYGLIEFPYPSGQGLHIGHIRSNTAMDIICRKRRAEGFNVLYPIGWDAFGLPTENYAIKTGIQPAVVTKKNTAIFRRQLKALGFSFDWSREINTSSPEYYKWTQWIFLKFFEKGLAYKKKFPINWCLSCKIGLANEEVVDGKCERCGSSTEKREKEQWMLAITKYAERLDKDLDEVDYLEEIKTQQRNWIGRSEGAEIEFKINTIPNPTQTLPQGEGDPKFYTTDKETWRELQDRAVEMRKNPTKAENILWQAIRKNLTGYHFRRQKIIGNFIVDFVCLEKMLVIEVDGDIHDHQKERDEERTNFLEQNDFHVVRFKNEEIENNAVNVIKKIHEVLKTLPFGEGLGGVRVFTTRADTLFGATYLVLSPEHSEIPNHKHQITNWGEVEKYIEQTKKKTEIERGDEKREKTGVKLDGVTAINPANGEEISIFVADYVLPDYGTGAIMAVPAHDERDWQFAKKYNLPITMVVCSHYPEPICPVLDEAYIGEGHLVGSGKFDGMESKEAAKAITEFVGGKITTKYKLRDWVFSRQRYWGEPIPLIFCEKDGWVAVPEEDLPVKLPKVKNFKPTESGESPLAQATKWLNVKCPKCGGQAKRETDTMPNWAGSSWYYLRYIDPKNKEEFANSEKLKYWLMPPPPSPLPRKGNIEDGKAPPLGEGLGGVDWYNGGMEHVTLHLLYSRFWHKFLFDLGLVPTNEPYKKRTAQGLILAEGGVKMSKSKGNVVNPDELVERFGADSLRVYEMFMGPFAQAINWSTDGMVGAKRFLERVWKLAHKLQAPNTKSQINSKFQILINQTVKKVTEDIETMRFNTAISALMILANEMDKLEKVAKDDFEILLRLLAPFAPHITEELWHGLGGKKSIHLAPWPKYDPAKAQGALAKIVIQVNGKTRGSMEIGRNLSQTEVEKQATALPEIAKWLAGQSVKKIIFVPGRLINFVVA